jgi:Ring finger domain
MMLAKLMEALKPSNVKHLSDECAICLKSFDEGSAMALRGCKHIFCSECLEQLKAQKKCPFCRSTFQEKDKITVEECKAALKKQNQNKTKASKVKTTTWDGEEEAPKIVYVSLSLLSCQPSPTHLVVSFVDRPGLLSVHSMS